MKIIKCKTQAELDAAVKQTGAIIELWGGEFVVRDSSQVAACPVRLKDMSVKANALMPEKIKAKGCCKPVYEVDIHGNPIETKEAA